MGHPDGLAVVGFLLEAVDAPNPKFDKFVEGLERIQKKDQPVQVPAGKFYELRDLWNLKKIYKQQIMKFKSYESVFTARGLLIFIEFSMAIPFYSFWCLSDLSKAPIYIQF